MAMKKKPGSRLEPHQAWINFFAYVNAVGNGVIDRVVVQDTLPIYTECVYKGIDLTSAEPPPSPPVENISALRVTGYSPEWTKIVAIAEEFRFCELYDLTIENGTPVRIGRLVNKEKMT